ncbi:argininosuccinate lyase [Clostridiales Family XIII bacterium PM5-7]
MVKYCEACQKSFDQVTKEDLERLNFDYGLEDLHRFTVENCIKNRNSFGGTSHEDVDRQIANGKRFLNIE